MALTMTVTADFPTLTPTASNPAVAGIDSNNNIYCRHCMYRLGMNWDGKKYITRSRAKKYIYNCYECGGRISEKRMHKNL